MPDDLLTKGERTRFAIIEAAYALFAAQGFHATSTRQIAAAAGVALGGIYNHFESKEQIFEVVLLERHPYRKVLAILNAAPGESVAEFIHNAAYAIIDELSHDPDFIKIGFIEFSEFKGKHAPLLHQTIFPEVLPLIQRLQAARGDLRDIPPQAVLFSFLGMFFSFYVTALAADPAGVARPNLALLDQYLDVLLHGVLRPAPLA